MDRTADEWACEKLVRRFALLNDSGRHDELVALFTKDAVYARPMDPGTRIVGQDAILATFKGRPPRVFRHFTANTVITLDGDTTATGVSYVILYTAAAGQEGLPAGDPAQLVGAYHDRFVKTAEGWRFAERLGSLAMKLGG